MNCVLIVTSSGDKVRYSVIAGDMNLCHLDETENMYLNPFITNLGFTQNVTTPTHLARCLVLLFSDIRIRSLLLAWHGTWAMGGSLTWVSIVASWKKIHRFGAWHMECGLILVEFADYILFIFHYLAL